MMKILIKSAFIINFKETVFLQNICSLLLICLHKYSYFELMQQYIPLMWKASKGK